MMSEPNPVALEAQFLSGAIADEFLPHAASGGFDDFIVNVWSTPICRWATRHTLLICPNPITRDPTTCENKP